MEFLKGRSQEHLNKMKEIGKQKIDGMDERARESATNTFIGATSAVSSYYAGAAAWLQGAQNSAGTWAPVEGAAARKVQQWTRATKIWKEAYDTAIEGWFKGDDFEKRGGRNNGNDNFAAVEGLATKLQFMGLENFTFVKKENGWALELSAE